MAAHGMVSNQAQTMRKVTFQWTADSLLAEPTPDSLAACMDRVWGDSNAARRMGEAGRDHYRTLGVSWENVVKRLVA